MTGTRLPRIVLTIDRVESTKPAGGVQCEQYGVRPFLFGAPNRALDVPGGDGRDGLIVEADAEHQRPTRGSFLRPGGSEIGRQTDR